jgi:hypothetical protein
MRKDMPAQDGRSRAVSTDVADTIEGMMPNASRTTSIGSRRFVGVRRNLFSRDSVPDIYSLDWV